MVVVWEVSSEAPSRAQNESVRAAHSASLSVLGRSGFCHKWLWRSVSSDVDSGHLTLPQVPCFLLIPLQR